MSQIVRVDSLEFETRLDAYLASKLDYSRSKIALLIKEKKIKNHGNPVKANQKVKLGDCFEIQDYVPKTSHLEAVAMDLNIIYEDDDLLVIDKPRGLAVHAGKGIYTPTLINGLFHHIKPLKPGLVHRIDKNTSGLLVVAKNDYTHDFLAKQALDKTMTRQYLAIVDGRLMETTEIKAPIGVDPTDSKRMAVNYENGKAAHSRFKPIALTNNHTLVHCELFTGRTHQIRVHLQSINHPIVEDASYNKNYPDGSGQFLFAYRLEFVHPKIHEKMVFNAPIPKYFEEKLNILNFEKVLFDI